MAHMYQLRRAAAAAEGACCAACILAGILHNMVTCMQAKFIKPIGDTACMHVHALLWA
jgi:hypothetical protein